MSSERKGEDPVLLPPPPKFKDTSTECAICLASLDGSEGGTTIELTCGHVYHLQCLSEQLKHAQPQYSKRLLFTGTRCAKCGAFCEHSSLEHLTRTTDALRVQVDALIIDQLQVDHPDYMALFRENNNSSGEDTDEDVGVELQRQEERRNLVDQGRRNYAFYLCSSCHEPYFGGTVECADQDVGELPSNDRLCPTCTPQSQSIGCTNPLEHRGFHVWKCRYCCQVSNHVCYGTTHFCQSCHDRNSVRVRQINAHGTSAPVLEPIPCPGGDHCPFPLPSGQARHENGPSASCELVYFCACCQSSPSRRQGLYLVEPGSRNWILNTSGELGLSGWRQHRRRMSWQVETSEIPVAAAVQTNFVSSFQWCVMSQSISLVQLLQHEQPARLEVSCMYLGRTDCPSVFRMEAIVIDQQHQVLQRVATPQLETSADCWEQARLVLEVVVPQQQARELVMVIFGKDQRFWQGSFGAKVAKCSVRVLGTAQELERVLQPNANEVMEQRLQELQRNQVREQRVQDLQRNNNDSSWLGSLASFFFPSFGSS